MNKSLEDENTFYGLIFVNGGRTHDGKAILRLSMVLKTQFNWRFTQYWQGHSPSHLTFFRLQISHAWLVRDPPPAPGGRFRRFPRRRSPAGKLSRSADEAVCSESFSMWQHVPSGGHHDQWGKRSKL